jgi:hypothetical protein
MIPTPRVLVTQLASISQALNTSASGAAIPPPAPTATAALLAALSMITKEKSPMRVLFFRDHEISGLRPAVGAVAIDG